MANPVASQTFDFEKVYLHERTGGVPGSGTWATAELIFDGTADPDFVDMTTFSAGALFATADRGMIGATDDAINSCLTFIGDGTPATPVRVHFTDQQSGITGNTQGYWNTAQGAFKSTAGDLYIALPNLIGFSTSPTVNIIKSSDGGATWAIQDQANGATGLPGGDGRFAAIQRVDNYIFVFTLVNQFLGTDFKIYPFNMDTDLWEAESAAVDLPNWSSFGGATAMPWSNGVIQFLNGDFCVFYNNSFNSTKFRMLVGGIAGAWGSEQAISSGRFANCVIDPELDLVHFFAYQTNSNSVRNAVHYGTIAQDGTLTFDIDIIPAVTPGPGKGSDGVGHCSIQNGMLLVPRDDTADNANAVWVADLPVTVPFQKELLPIPAGEEGKDPSCAYMMFPNGYSLIPEPTGLTLACPIDGGSGTVGVPYDKTLVVSGGTPPYTFTLV